MRLLKYLLGIVALLTILYLLGPRPATPVYDAHLPAVPAPADSLTAFIAAGEAVHHIKPDNEARIVWANDSVHRKTPYAIVYLHGFSASQEEGNPVHRNIARAFGCNLYLARLAEHGIDTSDALVNMTADNLWESAKQAYAIGKQLGEKVILMGTSTGGTLALQLAAAYPDVAGLVLLSPNIAINDPNAWITNNPWGLQIARLVKGSKLNMIPNRSDEYKKYWNDTYRLEAVTQLEELLESAMIPATFKKIKQPVLTLYYYKDEAQQDPVVKVSAMKAMFAGLSTSDSLKKMVPIPNAGNHVLGSPIQSKDIVSVENAISQYLQQVMHLNRRL
ncbi:MAG: alpha/beta fold hydrolase [Chitinophagaceae bacterium]|nr:alpha/beta fold hydrolase [Chitinophagaceae bacterium]